MDDTTFVRLCWAGILLFTVVIWALAIIGMKTLLA